MLGNICVILVVRGFPGVVVREATAGRKLLTEVTDHRGQTALGEPWCWRSGSERLVSTRRTAVHKHSSTVSQTSCGTAQKKPVIEDVSDLNKMWRLPCRWHWWTPWTCTEPAAAREPRTQLSPEEMNPAPLDPGNMQGLQTCKKTSSVIFHFSFFLAICLYCVATDRIEADRKWGERGNWCTFTYLV